MSLWAMHVWHQVHRDTECTTIKPYFAVTLSMYTLIPTVYRALLNSADHRIHTTKKTIKPCKLEEQKCGLTLQKNALLYATPPPPLRN